MPNLSFGLFSSEHGALILNRNDFHHTSNGGIYGVGWQVMHKGAYDVEEIALVKAELLRLKELRGANLTVLDCGANIGIFSLEMARLLPQGKVFAFEAQERIFYALCGNVALSNFENITAAYCAVGAQPGKIKVPRPNYSRPGSFGSLEINFSKNVEYIGQAVSYREEDMITAPLISIDSLQFSNVDFIKIDVEGMEMDVLRGAKETLEKYHPSIYVEWIKTEKKLLETILLDLGYTLKTYGGNILATIAPPPNS